MHCHHTPAGINTKAWELELWKENIFVTRFKSLVVCWHTVSYMLTDLYVLSKLHSHISHANTFNENIFF